MTLIERMTLLKFIYDFFFPEGEAEKGFLPTRQQRRADRRAHHHDSANSEYSNKSKQLQEKTYILYVLDSISSLSVTQDHFCLFHSA